MQLGDKLAEYIKNFSSYRTTMDFGDVAEILIIAVLLYYALAVSYTHLTLPTTSRV